MFLNIDYFFLFIKIVLLSLLIKLATIFIYFFGNIVTVHLVIMKEYSDPLVMYIQCR